MRRKTTLIGAVLVVMAGGAGHATAELTLWSAPAAEKVFRDTAPGTMPASGLELSCAGNETEAVQLVVRPAEDLAQVALAVGPLTAADGSAAPLRVTVLEVHYVPAPDTEQKLWPDPLPPHVRPINLAANQNQPFWLKVSVPSWLVPGEYRAAVSLSARDERIAEVPLTLTVYPFTISQTPHVRTAFGIWSPGLEAHHPVTPQRQAQKNVYARYYEMLLDHRISAYDIPYGLTDPRAVKYLRDPRMTSYVIPFTEDRQEFEATQRYLGKLGVFTRGIYYPIDEPVSRESYNTLRDRATYIHEMTGGTGKVCSPFFRGPDFDSRKDIFDYAPKWLDIWCINTGYFGPEQMKKMEAAGRRGGEPWWYVCCGPGAPRANFFVTMEAMRHRMLMWQMYKYGIQGLLYWSTTYWNPSSTKDPWVDIATVKDINPKLYGDGSLLYPGTRLGFNGPVSSQRLECIRDGLEDLEYLVCLERMHGREAADEFVSRLVTDMDKYSVDAGELAGVRDEIAQKLAPPPPAELVAPAPPPPAAGVTVPIP